MDTNLLVKAAQKGNASAFAELLSEHQNKLYRIAFAHFRNEQDAFEAMQEVACRAFKGIKKLKAPQYFSTWITRIVLNYCADELKRRDRSVSSWSGEMEPPPSEVEDDRIMAMDMRQAVDQLQPQSKQLIILKYYEDLTITQISQMLECPDGTIKTRLHKALRELRGLIRKEGDLG